MNRFCQCLAGSVLIAFLIVPAVLRADCPEGGRATTAAERQDYVRTLDALKAVPAAPAGWQLQNRGAGPSVAPEFACKSLKLVFEPYVVTYVSLEQEKRNEQGRREMNARIAAMRKLPPEEQKQADDFTRQGMQLSGQSAAARKSNPAEADRLRAQAKESYAKSAAIHQAHRLKTEPQIRALEFDRSSYGNPEVRVHLTVDDLPTAASRGSEKVQIPGVPQAYFDQRKDLVMSLGRDAAGRNIHVWLEGDRERVLTIARLLAESSLRTLAAK